VFLPGDSGNTVRHNKQITHITQNNTTIKRNTAHKTTHTIKDTPHRMTRNNHNYKQRITTTNKESQLQTNNHNYNVGHVYRFYENCSYFVSINGKVKSMADCLSGVITRGILETCTLPLTIMPITPLQEPFICLAPEELSNGLE
jgi:ATP-dependent 26S proteasome regulatory subunit